MLAIESGKHFKTRPMRDYVFFSKEVHFGLRGSQWLDTKCPLAPGHFRSILARQPINVSLQTFTASLVLESFPVLLSPVCSQRCIPCDLPFQGSVHNSTIQSPDDWLRQALVALGEGEYFTVFQHATASALSWLEFMSRLWIMDWSVSSLKNVNFLMKNMVLVFNLDPLSI